VAIYDEGWAYLVCDGDESHTINLRWNRPVNVKGQAALSGLGQDAICAIGFSAYVQSGQYHTIGSMDRGNWMPVFFMDDVTQLDISARSLQGWMRGGATLMLWD
jgi:hypothetical protein